MNLDLSSHVFVEVNVPRPFKEKKGRFLVNNNINYHHNHVTITSVSMSEEGQKSFL